LETGVVGVGLLVALRSKAQEPTPASTEANEISVTGPELAVRVGYATALGRIQRGERIRDDVAGAVPFWLDAGFRFSPKWFVGAYGHYGLGFASRTSENHCPNCQHSWVRYGLQVQYRFLTTNHRNLWVGLGAGQEFLNINIDEESRRTQSTRGWELVNAQFGAEWQPASGIGIGPYFSVSLDTFTSQQKACAKETECAVSERNVEVTLRDPGVHAWISAGVRVVVLP
jgi:hypothetical protein